MKKIYFISDLHVGAEFENQADIDQQLFTFFNFIKNPENELFIVGDLFDFWFEYKHVVPAKPYRVLFELSKLIEAGVKVHFLRGNHDCWIRDFLPSKIQIEIHPDIYTFEYNSKRVLLFHGDGILKSDRGYRLLKKIFRNRFNIFLYRWLHPDLGIPLAKLMSHTSRQHNSKRSASPNFDDYFNFAREKFNQGIDYVILCHTHQPQLKQIGENIFLNPGDWINHFTYGLLDENGLTLNHWNC
ncbi:hypothetical protein B6I21_02545 [candidate division KSB1 bacterium 4572_119]|nr:MAG: hypothetical protein B6I21_02545 [candidate division KSB1 bacterium 4572_119]